MDDDPGKTLEFLRLLQAARNIDPNDMLPSISSRELKGKINDENNKNKLIIVLFIESSNPAINIFHKQLSPIPKKTRMALGYYIDISENKNVISDYGLQKAITTILFKNGKDIKRFEGMLDQDQMTLIEENTPADPFSGGSHRITDMDKVDAEEYWKSVRRPKEAAPAAPPKKVKKISKIDDFLAKNNIALEEPQSMQPQSVEPTIPFLNPFKEEYENLVEELKNVSYEAEEISSAIIAGCAEMNEASEFIENVRNNVPNNKPLSFPGFNIDNLTPLQQETYEMAQVMELDPVQVLYILLYTGVEEGDDFMKVYEDHQNGIPLKPKDLIDLEVQRILNNSPTNFSMTAPQTNNNDYYSSMRAAQQEVMKEAQEAKRKREEEQKHKRDTIEAIRKQRELAKRAREAGLAKTSPVSAPKAAPPPKKQQNSTTATIRFRLPSGKTTDYTFNTTDTFETIERKLKDDKHVNEEDVIEFAVVPTPRIFRQDFGLQLKDKNIRGKVMMSIIILRQDPPAEQ